MTAPRSDFALVVEWYHGAVFSYVNSAPSRGWWCDGGIGLSVEQLDETAFRMIGAVYWAEYGRQQSPFYLATFEIEMYCHARQAAVPTRAIVRFGAADEEGNIQRVPCDNVATELIAKRPSQNSDWAIAVELTEP